MNPYVLWALYFPLQLAVSIFCKVTAPVVSLFVTKEYDPEMGFDREWLIKPFRYWQSFDHPLDHYFWAGYSKYSILPFIRNCTRETYLSNWFIRYLYRVLWIERNTAMGFTQNWFGRDPDQPNFQVKKQVPIGFGYVNDQNYGWKSHRGFTRLMYAGRVIGIRKLKKSNG